MSHALPKVIQIAVGHNNAAGLTSFPVEPYFTGIEYPGEVFTPAAVYDEGSAFAVLRFKVLTAAEYQLVMTRAGVLSAKSANVTVRLPATDRVTGANYNAQVIAPNRKPWTLLYYEDVELRLRGIEAI